MRTSSVLTSTKNQSSQRQKYRRSITGKHAPVFQTPSQLQTETSLFINEGSCIDNGWDRRRERETCSCRKHKSPGCHGSSFQVQNTLPVQLRAAWCNTSQIHKKEQLQCSVSTNPLGRLNVEYEANLTRQSGVMPTFTIFLTFWLGISAEELTSAHQERCFKNYLYILRLLVLDLDVSPCLLQIQRKRQESNSR